MQYSCSIHVLRMTCFEQNTKNVFFFDGLDQNWLCFDQLVGGEKCSTEFDSRVLNFVWLDPTRGFVLTNSIKNSPVEN